MIEDDLIRALEFITEGQEAALPKRLASEAFSTESFMQGVDKIKKESRKWTQGAGIQGLGIGEKVSDGKLWKNSLCESMLRKRNPSAS